MLGTGEAMVTKCYDTCFLLENGGAYYLVDAGGGNGILTQLEKAGVEYPRLLEMFVTHAHSDHLLGALWVVRAFAELMLDGKYGGSFTVRCHDEAAHVLRAICAMLLPPKLLQYIGDGKPIGIREVKSGERLQVIGMELEFFDIHSVKAKQFGFSAILPGGKKLVCLGDEPFNEANGKYVESADWLLTEAMCLDEDAERFKPYEKFHSTALDAARTARRLNVKNLLLYHTVDNDLGNRRERYTREAKRAFGGGVYVPDDLEIIDLG